MTIEESDQTFLRAIKLSMVRHCLLNTVEQNPMFAAMTEMVMRKDKPNQTYHIH